MSIVRVRAIRDALMENEMSNLQMNIAGVAESNAAEQKIGTANEPKLAVVPKLVHQLKELGVEFVPADERANRPRPSVQSSSEVAGCAYSKILVLPKIASLKIELKWLVRDLLPEGCLVMLSGESGCGKSTLALALADAVAHGKPFLGRPSENRRVLIVDRENNAAIYQERFNRLGIVESEFLHIWGQWCPDEPPKPTVDEICAFARAERPLIIFDSLVAFHEGSEQDSRDTRISMDRFRRLTKEGATVVVIHHTGKSENAQDYRGSSDFKASIDVGLKLESEDRLILHSLKLTSFKFREGIFEPLKIEVRENGEFVSVQDEQRSTIENILRAHPGHSIRQITQQSGVPKDKVEEILRVGVAKGYYTKVKGANNSWCHALTKSA